ncbi:MAG: hypothetical protein JNL69_10785, partial [Bacteroidia bacterium]|nr:hypothetical protein [Bacteroidia bacterium]
MKKIYTILFLLSFTFNFIFAQTSHPWELGINGGAAWYKSDVKMKKLGGGFGFTFGQSYCYNKNTALFWGWRFRYLGANTYGQDYQKSYGIKNNFALNGQSDTAINYVSNGGFVYQNYKSSLSEFSLEVKIGANQLRQKTKILAYVFGGAGLIKAVTYTDQLDANNKMYNYASIDSAGISGKGDILSRLNDMYDGNYETLAEGSKNPKWRFMPYVGAGLGYQFTPGFSMGLEHKMTWTRNDLVDGQQWTNTNEYTGTNDMYHYSSIWMKLSFGRKVKPTSSSTTTNNNSNVTNYTTDNTNTVVSIPVIKFTNPSTANYTSNQNTIIVKANISGVSNQSDITLTQNGNQVTNFTYNANVLTYTATLLTGDNSFVINATNVSGTATASANVNYTLPVVNSLPAPVITISSPNQNPFSTTMNGLSVLASVQNVSAANQITLTANGVNMPFNFSGNQLTYTANNLIAGSNTIVISATNTSGSDTKSITIIYNQPVALPAPVVLITSPASTNYNSSVSPLLVGASIQNITGIGQIAVTVNGGPVMSSALNFNPGTGQLSFNANLVQGSNAVIVSATNVSGADSKTLTVFYTAPVPVQLAPAITITNPVANPFTTNV